MKYFPLKFIVWVTTLGALALLFFLLWAFPCESYCHVGKQSIRERRVQC